MHDTHAILCFGKTLPGYDTLAVRRAIQHSFKCSDAEMNEMFSGAEVRLREALSADEAELWRQQLHGLGLKVMIDPPPLTRPSVPAGPDTGGPKPATARRASCADVDSPPVFGFGFQGRFGRAAYLKAWCSTFIAAGILVPVSMLLTDGAWGIPAATVALVLTLLTYFYPLRLTWLRCHDLGLNGVWALIIALPNVLAAALPADYLGARIPAVFHSNEVLVGFGFCVGLALLAWPGQRAENPWGPPPGRVNAIPAALGALVVAGAYVAFILSNLEPLHHLGVRFLSLPI